MANRSRRSPTPPLEGPTVPPEKGRELLTQQVEEGRALLTRPKVDEAAFTRWQATTERIMIAALGRAERLVALFRDAGELDHMLAFDEDLPPDHYRQRVVKSLPYMEEAIKLVSLGILKPAGRPASEAPSRINVTINAPVANVNLGTLVGDMQAHVSTLAGHGQGDVAKALRQLTEEVVKHGTIAENLKQEAAEYLSFLAEQATLQPERRKPGMIRSALTGLRGVLSVTADLLQHWQVFGPALTGFFGMGA